MIAGRAIVFRNGTDDPEIEQDVLVDLTEWGKEVEISFDAGRRRVYVKFRLEDLIREVKEARAESA